MDSIIVYEYLNNNFIYIPYSPEISNALETEYRNIMPGYKKSFKVDLATYDMDMVGYIVEMKDDKIIMKNVHNKYDRRMVQRSLHSPNHNVFKKYVWKWKDDISFQMYPAKVMKKLEDAYKTHKMDVDISTELNGLPYVVNLAHMKQINIDTLFPRTVERVLINEPYLQDVPGNMPPISSGSNQVSPLSSIASGFSPNAPSSTSQLNTTYHTSNGANGRRLNQGPQQNNAQGQVGVLGKTMSQWTNYAANLFKRSKLDPPNQPILNTERKSISTLKHLGEDVIATYASPLNNVDTNDECCICMDNFTNDPSVDEERVVGLNICKHQYHFGCLVRCYNSGVQDGHIQCPTCKKDYGDKTGSCPPGEMIYTRHESKSLPGHHGHGYIAISYSISEGVQGPEHPNPGKRYRCVGFPRVGYLPDSPEGREILALLIKAWRRRLTFTVGTSSTSGASDCVIWNEIHHKTSIDNTLGHGYPDPKYLKNVREELAAQGVN